MSAPTQIPTTVVHEIERSLQVLHRTGDIFEIRAPKTRAWGTISGYYTDPAAAARHIAAKYDGRVAGVYSTLNTVDPTAQARAANRLQTHTPEGSTTKDREIQRLLWILLDFDPERLSGISSTEYEHRAALERAGFVFEYVTQVLGLPELVVADSANGAHLLLPIDLPNDKESLALVKRVLEAIAGTFSDNAVHLDTGVGNASRITKVYGTMVMKGDNLPDRPHRRSRLLSVPDALEVVTAEQLRHLCEELGFDATISSSCIGKKTSSSGQMQSPLHIADAGEYLAQHSVEVAREKRDGSAIIYALKSCPFSQEHTDGAFVVQRHDGSITAKCHHNSCQGKGLNDLRDAVEPEWRGQNTPRTYERNEENERNGHRQQNEPLNSFLSFSSYPQRESVEGDADDFPRLDKAAFYGTAGDIVAAIEPHTEASPVALLAQLLVCVGNAAGRHVYYVQEADRHYANLYLCLVGDTAKARKGTSWGHVNRVMLQADPTWAAKHVIGGLSSGEGIIHALRNVSDAELPLGDEGELLRDKRLTAREGEFASVLAQKARDGNILSGVLRDGWDGGPLGNLTKNSPERATDTHLSVIGHITQAELVKHMAATDLLNGYANRFLFVATKRARLLPHGGDLDAVTKATEAPIRYLSTALEWARMPRKIAHDRDAYDLWEAEYERLTTGHPGLFGAVTSRAEAQVTRLSLIYALLDCSPAVTTQHLRAALALWQYCERSALYIFGDLLGDTVADRILASLRGTPAGLTRTEISELFDRNVAKARIDAALSELERAKLAYKVAGVPVPGEKGRPPERWMACKKTKETK